MLTHFAKLCVLFLLSGVLAAQETPSRKLENTPSKGTCSIAGVVVKLGTSEPLKKAHVYLQKVDDPKSGYSAHTDAAGQFSIQKIDPGRYYLQVEHAGYIGQSYGEHSQRSSGAVLALDPGREIKDLLFRMVASAVISGRITDEDGDPVSYVQVEAMRHHLSQGKRTLVREASVETNDLGEFRLHGLAKGHYFIRAQVRQDWQPAIPASSASDPGSSAQTGYAPVYYPGTSDQSRAATIEVAAGQDVPAVDFTLIPIRTFRVRGLVFDAVLGQSAKNCMIYLVRHDPNLSSWSGQEGWTECGKGSFEFSNVAPGAYNLVAMLSGSGNHRSGRTLVDVNNTNVEDVRLVVGAPTELTGRVLVEGKEPVDFSELWIWLNDPEQDFDGGAGAVVKADGSLIFESVPEGTFQIGVRGQPPGFSPDFYLKSARVNGDDILGRGLTIGAGSARGTLDIVLSSAGTRIEGTVTDENDLPSAGAVVALVPEGERRHQFRLYKDTTTDQYGKFILRGVAPGTYKLFSWKEVENNAWEDPDFLAPFEGEGTKITAEENGRITTQLKLIPTDKLQQ